MRWYCLILFFFLMVWLLIRFLSAFGLYQLHIFWKYFWSPCWLTAKLLSIDEQQRNSSQMSKSYYNSLQCFKNIQSKSSLPKKMLILTLIYNSKPFFMSTYLKIHLTQKTAPLIFRKIKGGESLQFLVWDWFFKSMFL